MDGKTSGKQHLAFTDAEINTTIANGVRLHQETAIEACVPPFDPASDAVYAQPQRQGLGGSISTIPHCRARRDLRR